MTGSPSWPHPPREGGPAAARPGQAEEPRPPDSNPDEASVEPIELRDEIPPEPPSGGPRRRSLWWVKWALLAAAVAGLRLVRPLVIAPFVAQRLSRALGTEVQVRDLGFQPLDAVFTLRGVRVMPAADAATDGAVTPVVAEIVRADVQWLPLFHRTLRLRELVLEGADLEMVRLADGGLGLAGVTEPDAARGLPAGWGFELDRVALRDSRVRLRDPAATGAKPFEMRVREGEISGLHRRATAFGRTANLRLDADVGSGRLASYGRYEVGDDGLSVDLRTRMKNVPVAEAFANLPDLGWGEISGLLSGLMRWQRDPDRRDKVSGRLVLRRGEVRVPGFDAPAFLVRRATADVDAVDLVERHVGIGSLVLQGGSLAVRPDADDPIPLFGSRMAPPPPKPAHAHKHKPTAKEDDKAAPWVWIVKKFDTPNGRVRSVTPTGVVEAHARASGENLGPRAYWSPLKVRLWGGEGAAVFEGTARIGSEFAADGRITAGGVDVGQVSRAVGMHGAEWVRGGRLAADLSVQIDTGDREGQPIDASGPLLLTDLALVGPVPEDFSAGAAEASMTVSGVSIRGRGAKPATVTALRCSDVRVQQPYLQLARGPDGWSIPIAAENLVAEAAAANATPTPVPAATPRPGRHRGAAREKSTDDADHSDDVAAPSFAEMSPQLVLSGVRASGGRLYVVDRVPQPAVTWDVSRLDVSGRDVRVPSPAIDGLRLAGHDPRFGDVQLAIRRGERRSGWDFTAQGMLLAAATPYLQLAGLPFRFGGGSGAVDTRISVGEADWTADTEITLRDPHLVGAVSGLEDAIGRTIPRALSELRDSSGNVTVRLPLSSGDVARSGLLVQKVATGVREEIRRIALAPPRPPVTAAEADDDDVAPPPAPRPAPRATPVPARRRAEVARLDVLFSPGRSDLNQAGVEQVSSVAKTLLSRPELVVQLSTAIAAADRRWLAEQALAQDLSRPDALRGVLRAFGVGATRERIRAALAARAQGLPGLLAGEDEEELQQYLAERPPIGQAELQALREARISRVANRLSDYHGISRRRIVIDRVEPTGGQPIVRLTVIDEASRAATVAPASGAGGNAGAVAPAGIAPARPAASGGAPSGRD